jgi:hypothetical protein
VSRKCQYQTGVSKPEWCCDGKEEVAEVESPVADVDCPVAEVDSPVADVYSSVVEVDNPVADVFRTQERETFFLNLCLIMIDTV